MRRCFRSSLWLSPPSNYVCSSCARHIATVPLEVASCQGTTRSLDKLPGVAPDLAQSAEYRQLLHLLGQSSHISSPDTTWQAYSNLVRVNLMAGSRIPFEVHRRVLRRAIPIYVKSLSDAMSLKARKSRHTASLHGWCPYQYRMDAILEHIRHSGALPHMEDYHLILLHYAVWGNIQGSLELLRGLVTGGSSPAARTYELVLYSFVRKLALVRHWEHTREDLLPLLEKEFLAVVKDMKGRDIRQTRLINDHCTRIVGAVSSRQSFDSMVAAVHGIDVTQPDSVPPQFANQFLAVSEGGRRSLAPEVLQTEREFPSISTATLNTLVRVLGSGPNSSLAAMIGTFESLTYPLPPLRPKREAYGYEDGVDDDEPHYVPPARLRRTQPTRPNTQTYSYLIQNCIAMRNKTLAKHYLDQAIGDERAQEQAIRARVRNIMYDPADGSVQITAENMARMRSEVPRANVGVNASMFKALYRYADEWGDGALVRWVNRRELAVIREKQRSVRLLAAISEAMDLVDAERGFAPQESPIQGQHGDQYNAQYEVSFDHRAHLRVHTRNIADIRNHMEFTTGQLHQAEAQAPQAASSAKRLRERKIRKQANSFVTKELDMNWATAEQSDPVAVARIREQYRRQWAASMTAQSLQKLSDETLNNIDLGIFSELPLMGTQSSAAEHKSDDGLAQSEQPEDVSELRVAITSMPHQRDSSAAVLAALRVPLAHDSQLHRYDNLPADFASPFDVEDHHMYAPGVRKMRSRGKKQRGAREASTGLNNIPEYTESKEHVHTPYV